MVELCHGWRSAATLRERDRALAELWFLLNAALARYVRLHGRVYGSIDAEDARDVASEKAMAFLRALENATAETSALDPPRVCSYISVLARNGLVDALRKRGRDHAVAHAAGESRVASYDSAEANVQHEEFVAAVRACVMQMTPRARSAWFMRAFLDMSSKRIANHPDVRMTPAAVDVMLMRTRRALRDCLQRKGLGAEDAPPGTFVVLWDLLRRGSAEEREPE